MVIHNDLLERGYSLRAMLPDRTLYRDLAQVIVDLAIEDAKKSRIVPGDIAFRESDYEFEEPVHLVYAKEKKSKERKLCVILPYLRCRKTGELTSTVNICGKI